MGDAVPDLLAASEPRESNPKRLITRITDFLRAPFVVVWEAIEGWFNDRCSSQAAALAFFALFSLAPMLVLVVAIAGYVVDASVVPDRIFAELSNVVGANAAEAVRATVAQSQLSDWSSEATIASIIVTIVGATATFAELKSALNAILVTQIIAPPAFSSLTWAFVKARLLSAALVAGIGFLLIVSLAFDAMMTMLGGPFASALTWLRVDLLASAVVLALAFALLLKVLPDAYVQWTDAFWGGVVASIMFTLGKYVFALYLAAAGTANAFGAAGSVAVTLMWLFYSAAVFFFGAEIVRARRVIRARNELALSLQLGT